MRTTAWVSAVLLSSAALLVACSDDGGTDEGMAGSTMTAGSSGSGGSMSMAGSDMGGSAGMGMAGSDMQSAVSFSEIHPIFVAKCGDASCHVEGSGIPAHGDEDIDTAYQEATAESFFSGGPVYEQILIRTMAEDAANLMPPSYADPPCFVFGEGGCLTQGEYDLIEQWVEDGTNP